MKRFMAIGLLGMSLALGLVLGALLASVSAYAEPSPDVYVQLPVLGAVGGVADTSTQFVIEAQNVGRVPTKVALLLFTYSGFCPPQNAKPLKLECSGLLQPGSTWVWSGPSGLPAGAWSGIAFSYQDNYTNKSGKTINCDYLEGQRTGGAWPTSWDFYKALAVAGAKFPYDFEFETFFNGEPIAVEVVRRGSGTPDKTLPVTGKYSGVASVDEATFDPQYGGFVYFVPVVKGSLSAGINTTLYIQNSGDECTSVEIWFEAKDQCIRQQVCSIQQLAPGETYLGKTGFDVGGCTGPDFIGSAWVRSSQPLGIVADETGGNVLLSYNQSPALHSTTNGDASETIPGSLVAYGPLWYRENGGWNTKVYVQNLSGVQAAKVKVYFTDHVGGIIGSPQVDWICQHGVQVFNLAALADLGGRYVGSLRVESQDFTVPGERPQAAARISGVVELSKNVPATDARQEAVAYNLIPEQQAYDWQTGAEDEFNVYRIGIPSFSRAGGLFGTLPLKTELAIENVNPNPGWTDLGVYIFDQNGYIDRVCEKLNEKQVEYIDLDTWNNLPARFVGSAVIQADFRSSTQREPTGKNDKTIGLAAVIVERVSSTVTGPIAGDESSATDATPLQGRLTINVQNALDRVFLPCTDNP